MIFALYGFQLATGGQNIYVFYNTFDSNYVLIVRISYLKNSFIKLI